MENEELSNAKLEMKIPEMKTQNGIPKMKNPTGCSGQGRRSVRSGQHQWGLDRIWKYGMMIC